MPREPCAMIKREREKALWPVASKWALGSHDPIPSKGARVLGCGWPQNRTLGFKRAWSASRSPYPPLVNRHGAAAAVFVLLRRPPPPLVDEEILKVSSITKDFRTHVLFWSSSHAPARLIAMRWWFALGSPLGSFRVVALNSELLWTKSVGWSMFLVKPISHARSKALDRNVLYINATRTFVSFINFAVGIAYWSTYHSTG